MKADGDYTAFDWYYISLMQGKLPASVPVCTSTGQYGMVTGGADLSGEKARALALSPIARDRAVAAICAIESTMRAFV